MPWAIRFPEPQVTRKCWGDRPRAGLSVLASREQHRHGGTSSPTPQDKRVTSGKYQDVYVELNHIKTRSEQEIEQLKEHLRLAMAALQEKEAMSNSLAE